MVHYIKLIKGNFTKVIRQMCKDSRLYVKDAKRDFTRNSMLCFKKTILTVLCLRGMSLSNELLDIFKKSKTIPTSSAFVQQRSKLRHEAFEHLFTSFTEMSDPKKLYKSYRLLADDGSDIRTVTNPNDKDSYVNPDNGRKSYNLYHLNALYDLRSHIYVEAVVQGKNVYNESKALTEMVDRSYIPSAIVIGDRGFESYNNMAHIQEKGWKFLIRVKDGSSGICSGLNLPSSDEFDLPLDLSLTRRHTKEVYKLLEDKNKYKFLSSTAIFDYLDTVNEKGAPVVFFKLSFRVVRFCLTDSSFETVVTNLDPNEFPPSELKRLYAMRWGIETSFRDLKYTIGVLYFHSKKMESILQEIYAGLFMYNFCELIASNVMVQKKKYAYKANFSSAVAICRQFFSGRIPPSKVEALINKYLTPIRPNRSEPIKRTFKPPVGFGYRVS